VARARGDRFDVRIPALADRRIALDLPGDLPLIYPMSLSRR